MKFSKKKRNDQAELISALLKKTGEQKEIVDKLLSLTSQKLTSEGCTEVDRSMQWSILRTLGQALLTVSCVALDYYKVEFPEVQ